MRIPTTGKLFDWESLDDSPDLKTLRLFLEWLPDSKILHALRLRRYKGVNVRRSASGGDFCGV